jgi:hypothetical protein
VIVAALPLLGLAASGLLPGLPEAIAYLLPPLLLLTTLLARRYPGERALLAVIARRGRWGRAAGDVRPHPAGLHPRALVPRGGSLLAFSLAVRPPPALVEP